MLYCVLYQSEGEDVVCGYFEHREDAETFAELRKGKVLVFFRSKLDM